MREENSEPKFLKSQYVPTAEFYSHIIDSLEDYSIFTFDEQLLINSWSKGSAKIFQYETEEIIGKHFEIIFTDEDKKIGIPKREANTALEVGRAVDNRWHLCKDGSKFYANGLVFPLLDLNGEMLGYVKILRDITISKRSEDAIKKYVKELEELNTHKESILAILSHDLRAPLSGIIQGTEFLSLNYESMKKQEIQELLDYIHAASKDELKMLDYLVEWARIKYAADAFSPSQIELIAYINKVFAILNEAAALNAINLHSEIEENTTVFADGKMLISILHNIVSNAIKHSNKNGKITISAKKEDGKLIVQVKDTGKGMSKEIQDMLFSPQVKILSMARKENKGAGIGLLLVKGFLEKCGGEIWVESEEGKGSSFYFTLPLEKPLEKRKELENLDLAAEE